MELKDLFDPGESSEYRERVLRLVEPALVESFEYGLRVFTRCWNEAQRDDKPFVAFSPYHTFLDVHDATNAVIRLGGGVGSHPLLRTMFECLLTLQYLHQEDRERRAAAFAVADLHKSIVFLLGLDPSTNEGKQLQAAVARDTVAAGVAGSHHFRDKSSEVALLKSFLANVHLKEAEAEWQSVKAAGGRPPWYRLFGGPSNLEALARHLGRDFQYQILYRQLSATAHAEELHRVARPGAHFKLRTVRDTSTLDLSVRLALLIASECHREMLRGFREEEADDNHIRWWNDKIAPTMDALNELIPPEVRRWIGIGSHPSPPSPPPGGPPTA